MTSKTQIRPIRPRDNAAVAELIRMVMVEFKASGAGFSIEDPEVDSMYEAYNLPTKAFYVVELADGSIAGCGGIGPLEGGGEGICELKKMYFLPQIRGFGLGEKLLKLCLSAARKLGYQKCYLETLVDMDQAKKLYEKFGFQPLLGPLGNTGHFGCDAWYILDLEIKPT